MLPFVVSRTATERGKGHSIRLEYLIYIHFNFPYRAHNRFKNEISTQTFGIDKMVVYPRYLTDTWYGYDIGLIKLSRPAVLNFAVGLACLPRQGDRIPVGTKCYVSGWGSTSYRSAKSITLQQTLLPIVSHHTCQAGNSWSTPIYNSDICAGFGGNTSMHACHGDSGGPLICEENGQWVVRGAVSRGDSKCRGGTTYTVFARISSFVDWINMHTAVKPAPCVAQPDLGDDCSDNHYYCALWKEKGLCKHYYFKRSLKNYCPFSCGYCTLSVKAKCLDPFIDSILQDLSE
ncbi:hypothetical protein QZH41_019791 [Actinostola sp. cb2023]|nr:hypothetical protein QZH41_019791 [Actinostola sp. cb2023]